MNTKELLKNNKEEVHKFNQQIVPKVFIITVLTLFIPIISAIFSESMRQNVPAYVLTMVTLLGLLGLSKIPKLKPYPLVFVYIFGLVVFALFLYLSIVKFPTCKCQLRNVQKWRNEIVQLWRFSFELCFDYHHHLQTRFYLLYDKIFQLF